MRPWSRRQARIVAHLAVTVSEYAVSEYAVSEYAVSESGGRVI